MQHVRIATYDIKDGTFQELAEIARKDMLRTFQEQPGFIRYGLVDCGDQKFVSLSLWQTRWTRTRRSPWPSAGCARTSRTAWH
jgi:heme-degrading monooxygenase HmoA